MKVFKSPSLSMKLVRWLLSRQTNRFRDVERLTDAMARRAAPVDAALSPWLRRHCDIDWLDGPHGAVVTLTPRSGASAWRVLYLHGGAYILPLLKPQWNIVRSIISQTGAIVTVPLYRLAPEHTHEQAWDLVDAAYDRLTEEADAKIAVAGDSAGANFALSLALRIRDSARRSIDRIILFSPWLDLTLADPRAREIEPDDVILAVDGLRACGQWWAGRREPGEPIFSPLYANLETISPVAIFQGSADIFVIDSRTFYSRGVEQGLDIRYYEYTGSFHDFMAATFTPEARDVYHRVNSFLGEAI